MKWRKAMLLLLAGGSAACRLCCRANTCEEGLTSFHGTVQVRLIGHQRRMINVPFALDNIEQEYWTNGRQDIISQVKALL
jgi:hypothetical protein